MLLHTVPFSKPVKFIKFFKIVENNTEIDAIAVAIQDEISLIILRKSSAVVEIIKADLKYV